LVTSETEFTNYQNIYFWHAVQLPDADKRPQVAELNKRKALEAYDVLEKELEGKTYLVNDTFSAADIALVYGVAIFKFVQFDDPDRYPNVRAYYDRLAERPGWKDTFQPGST